jgi:uncharacterized protein
MPKSPASNTNTFPGFGLGIRPQHYPHILQTQHAVDWLEIDTERHMLPGGKNMAMLDDILAHYPVAMHGVSLSIGSTDGLNINYLSELKKLVHRIQPLWVSDHLCWTGVQGNNAHALLPLPYSDEALQLVIRHVKQVQETLDQRILLENITSFVNFRSSEMSEWEFLRHVAEQADCLLLLDLNSLYVNSLNHDFDAINYLEHLPINRVQQFHLSGHTDHSEPLPGNVAQMTSEPVWRLYQYACKRFGKVATSIACRENTPDPANLLTQLTRARGIVAEVCDTHGVTA